MREILRTSSVSFAEGFRVALEAAGIPASIANSNLRLPSNPITVTIADDEDYDRALTILRGLQQSPNPRWLDRRRPGFVLLLLVLALIIIVCVDVF